MFWLFSFTHMSYFFILPKMFLITCFSKKETNVFKNGINNIIEHTTLINILKLIYILWALVNLIWVLINLLYLTFMKLL